MYTKARSKRFLLSLAICLFALSGCIKEDLSECPTPEPKPDPKPESGLILKYRYDLNMDYADKFAERVQNLQAFIFDGEGILRQVTPLFPAGTFVPGWEYRINDLAPGTYSVYTWAGSDKFDEHYFTAQTNDNVSEFKPGVVVGQTKLEDMRVFLKYVTSPDNKELSFPCTPAIRDLYHGLLQGVTVKAYEITTALTPLVKNTNTIRIRIEGLENLPEGGSAEDFELTLSGKNSHYQYDNLIHEQSRYLIYKPFSQTLNETLNAEIKTLRLMKLQEDPYRSTLLLLNITHRPSNTKICNNVDLVDLILNGKIPARDAQGKEIVDDKGTTVYITPTLEYLDRQDVFDLKFEISKDINDRELIITVRVNDWKITNIYPVL